MVEPNARGPECALRQYLAHGLEPASCNPPACGVLDRLLVNGMNTFPPPPPPSSLEAKASRCLLFEQLLSGSRRKQERMLVPDLATNWFRKQKDYVDKLSTEELAALSSGFLIKDESYDDGCAESTAAKVSECLPRSRNPFLLTSTEGQNKWLLCPSETNRGSNDRSPCSCLLQDMSRECLSPRRTEPLLPRLRRKYDLRKVPQRRLDPSAFRRISPEFFTILEAYETAMSECCPLYGISMHHWGETEDSVVEQSSAADTWEKQHFLGDDAMVTAVVSPCRLPCRTPKEGSEEEQKQYQKQKQKPKKSSCPCKVSFADIGANQPCNNDTCPALMGSWCSEWTHNQEDMEPQSWCPNYQPVSVVSHSSLSAKEDPQQRLVDIDEQKKELEQEQQQQEKQLQQQLQQKQKQLKQQQQKLQHEQQQLQQQLSQLSHKSQGPKTQVPKKRRLWRNCFRPSRFKKTAMKTFVPALSSLAPLPTHSLPSLPPTASSLYTTFSAGPTLSTASNRKKNIFGGVSGHTKRVSRTGQHLLYNLGTNFHQNTVNCDKPRPNKPKPQIFVSSPAPNTWHKKEPAVVGNEMRTEDSNTTLMPLDYGYNNQEQHQKEQKELQQQQEQHKPSVTETIWQGQLPKKQPSSEKSHIRAQPSARTLAGFAQFPESNELCANCPCGCNNRQLEIPIYCDYPSQSSPLQQTSLTPSMISSPQFQEAPKEEPAPTIAEPPESGIRKNESTETDYTRCGYRPRAFYLTNDYHQLMRRVAKPRPREERLKRKKPLEQVSSTTKVKPKPSLKPRPKRASAELKPKSQTPSPIITNLPEETFTAPQVPCNCGCMDISQTQAQPQSEIPLGTTQNYAESQQIQEHSSLLFVRGQWPNQEEPPTCSQPATSTGSQPPTSTSSQPISPNPSCPQRIHSQRPSSLKKCVATPSTTTVSVEPPPLPQRRIPCPKRKIPSRSTTPPRRKPSSSPAPTRRREWKLQTPIRRPVVLKKPSRKRENSCDSASSVRMQRERERERERSSSDYRYSQSEASLCRRRPKLRCECYKYFDRPYPRGNYNSAATGRTKTVSVSSSWSQPLPQRSRKTYCPRWSDYAGRCQPSTQQSNNASYSQQQARVSYNQGEPPCLRSSLRRKSSVQGHCPSYALPRPATYLAPPRQASSFASAKQASCLAPPRRASSFAQPERMAPGRRYYTDTQPGRAVGAKFSRRSLHTNCSIRALSSNTDSVRLPCAPAPSVASVEPPPACLGVKQVEPYCQCQQQQQQQPPQAIMQPTPPSCPAAHPPPPPSGFKLFSQKPVYFKEPKPWEVQEHRHTRTRLRTHRPPPVPRPKVHYYPAAVQWQQRQDNYNSYNALYCPAANYQRWGSDPPPTFYQQQAQPVQEIRLRNQPYPYAFAHQPRQQTAVPFQGTNMQQNGAIVAATQSLRGLVQALDGARHRSQHGMVSRESKQQETDYSKETIESSQQSCYSELQQPREEFSYGTGSSCLYSDQPSYTPNEASRTSGSCYTRGNTGSERTWSSMEQAPPAAARLDTGISAERSARERRRGPNTEAFSSFSSGMDFRPDPYARQRMMGDQIQRRQSGGALIEDKEQSVTKPTPLAIFLDQLRANHDATQIRTQPETRATSSSEDDSLERRQQPPLKAKPLVIPPTYTGLLEEQVINEYLPRPRCKRWT